MLLLAKFIDRASSIGLEGETWPLTLITILCYEAQAAALFLIFSPFRNQPIFIFEYRLYLLTYF